ncbi:hypothetical protein [Arsenicicoccus piscis]|uniref:hypothetical protein n=1 Tax=Arsenicicoccus piscis TaxID=673954 RepID=UPI0024E0A244|nr:hypothetical protein [Arsenicicoccus piscis]
MTDRPAVPPGWPAAVRPPDTQGWQSSAASWLLDQCPPDYRAYPGWRRHPVALAWVATVHVDAQLDAMRTAYRRIRVELGEHLTPEALRQTMADLESEGCASSRSRVAPTWSTTPCRESAMCLGSDLDVIVWTVVLPPTLGDGPHRGCP